MKTTGYQYSIAQCDVPPERRAKLEAFRAKRASWIEWIDDDEHHAIWTTISAMVWTDVSFRTMAKLATDHENSCLGNSLIAEALINGHVATQVLGIRRLMDNSGSGVMSLRRLIKDVRSNFDLFTRENYVCHDGLPYDYEPAQTKAMMAHAGRGPVWLPTTGPEAYSTSQMIHEQFDRLSGTDPSMRSRDDPLPITLIKTVEAWLDQSGADDLAKWSHAYLAHAGTPQRRESIAGLMVTTNKITEAIRELARATEAVSAEILFASGRLNSLMPTGQFDQFENLDKPVMSADSSDEAHRLWTLLSDERDSYLEGVREDLLRAAKPGKAQP
jgi:hypothetical protein